MKLNQSSIVLKTGQKTKCLKVTGLAKGDFISTWSTDNWSIADVSVSSDGTCNITAGKTTGKTRIHIYLNSGYEKSVTVKVQKTAVKTTKIKGVPKNTEIKEKSEIFPETGFKTSNKQRKNHLQIQLLQGGKGRFQGQNYCKEKRNSRNYGESMGRKQLSVR